MKFQGVYTALVTPFNQDGSIDKGALKTLVDQQIAAGVAGLVPMGTTGESPTLSHEEHLEVISNVVQWTAGRVRVIAGAGSNSTAEALHLAKKAKEGGADATLQVVPYYNKPNAEGQYRHFMTVADEVSLPMIIYNIAGRTGKNMETETLMKLAQHPHVVGVKESSGDLNQIMDVLARRPAHFSVLSGDDVLLWPLLALGGDGVISVASHLIAKDLVTLTKAGLSGDMQTAKTLHFRFLPLFRDLFLDTNPIPVKTALALQGRMREYFRLPMVPLSESDKTRLVKVLQNYQLV